MGVKTQTKHSNYLFSKFFVINSDIFQKKKIGLSNTQIIVAKR